LKKSCGAKTIFRAVAFQNDKNFGAKLKTFSPRVVNDGNKGVKSFLQMEAMAMKEA
jgi:hypothetical protein